MHLQRVRELLLVEAKVYGLLQCSHSRLGNHEQLVEMHLDPSYELGMCQMRCDFSMEQADPH